MSSKGKGNRAQKIAEVKEVVQNRSNTEIQKILDYFDYDVGKTINAFVEGNVKEVLEKMKTKSQQAKTDVTVALAVEQPASEQTATTTNENKNPRAKNNKKDSKQKTIDTNNNRNSNPKNNINDIVNSVIHKYTTLSLCTSINSDSLNDSLNTSSILPSTSTTITDTATNASSSNQLNVKLNNALRNAKLIDENVEQPTVHVNTQVTVPIATITTATATVVTSKRPSNYINVNAKKVLEKSQKDLQRQITSLTKITTSFEEEMDNSSKLLNDTFKRLRELLDRRESELQHELDHIKSHGNELLSRRQQKANELRQAIETCENLTDDEVQDLKANVKHFVGERKLDEELGMTKRFNFDQQNIQNSIQTFGTLTKIENNYSIIQRTSGASDNLNNSNNSDASTGPTVVMAAPSSVQQTNGSVNSNLDNIKDEPKNNFKLNGLTNGHAATVNGYVNGKTGQSEHHQMNGVNGKPQRARNDQQAKQQRPQFTNKNSTTQPNTNGNGASKPVNNEAIQVNGDQQVTAQRKSARNNNSSNKTTQAQQQQPQPQRNQRTNGKIPNGGLKQNGVNGEHHNDIAMAN